MLLQVTSHHSGQQGGKVREEKAGGKKEEEEEGEREEYKEEKKTFCLSLIVNIKTQQYIVLYLRRRILSLAFIPQFFLLVS